MERERHQVFVLLDSNNNNKGIVLKYKLRKTDENKKIERGKIKSATHSVK